ncbi:hypothetical protein PG994_001405 [Apiospora phragmitis]|uniref:Uncharacterized protein n=1 Tax=Apiospora phragmitis TaxID=2905665 RepID=A0ABR1WTE7_9PEZI
MRYALLRLNWTASSMRTASSKTSSTLPLVLDGFVTYDSFLLNRTHRCRSCSEGAVGVILHCHQLGRPGKKSHHTAMSNLVHVLVTGNKPLALFDERAKGSHTGCESAKRAPSKLFDGEPGHMGENHEGDPSSLRASEEDAMLGQQSAARGTMLRRALPRLQEPAKQYGERLDDTNLDLNRTP